MQFVKNAAEAMIIELGHCQLKFNNEKGIELGNSDWIARVDHDDLLCQNNTNEDERDGKSSDDESCMPDLEQHNSEDSTDDESTHN